MSSRTVLAMWPAALFCAGCDTGPGTLAEYRRWVSDPANGLVVERQAENLGLRLTYQPPELLALDNAAWEPLAPDSLVEHFRGSHHFVLRLQASDAPDLLLAPSAAGHDYNAKQYYYTALVEEDLLLVVGGDTIPCAQAHFERNYGAAPFNHLVFSFIDDADDPYRDDLTLVYTDRAFGVGPVTFTLRRDDLRAIPELKRS